MDWMKITKNGSILGRKVLGEVDIYADNDRERGRNNNTWKKDRDTERKVKKEKRTKIERGEETIIQERKTDTERKNNKRKKEER